MNYVLNPKYLSMLIDSIEYLGDIEFILRESICPSDFYSTHYGDHNRFSKRSLKNPMSSIERVDLQSYQNFLSECNNTASLDYNVSACWQRFRVDYTIYFNESERLNTQNLAERRVYYNHLLLDSILTYRDENVILAKLNDSKNVDKVYLKVNSVTDECRKYLISHNLNDQNSFDECLTGKVDGLLFNQTKGDIFMTQDNLINNDFYGKIYYICGNGPKYSAV